MGTYDRWDLPGQRAMHVPGGGARGEQQETPDPSAREAAREFVDHVMWSDGEDGLDWCCNLPDFLSQPPAVQAAIREMLADETKGA